MQRCAGCDKDFQDSETAPYQKNADGTYSFGCRACINQWIKDGVLWGSIPFWVRQKGMDKI